jgi:hypothetical protein
MSMPLNEKYKCNEKYLSSKTNINGMYFITSCNLLVFRYTGVNYKIKNTSCLFLSLYDTIEKRFDSLSHDQILNEIDELFDVNK